MGRQSRPLMGQAMPQGWPTGAAIRACEFRRSASLFWECEGFETDNLARQSAGMRRAATLPLGSTHARRKDDVEICARLTLHRHGRALRAHDEPCVLEERTQARLRATPLPHRR